MGGQKGDDSSPKGKSSWVTVWQETKRRKARRKRKKEGRLYSNIGQKAAKEACAHF